MVSSTYETCLADLTASSSSTPSTEDLLVCISNSFDDQKASTNSAVNVFFLLYAASMVFLMQSGFAMVAAGCVRTNNVMNTLLKNLLDACGAALGFYSVGYAFAWGGSFHDQNTTDITFIGKENFFMAGLDFTEKSFWLFQLAFCSASATIVAGTLAERCQMVAYLAYSLMLAGFVYPVVVHSIWSPSGFLSANRDNDVLFGVGMIDFAGSTVVHLTGGMTALIATIVLGPRTGRFTDLRGRVLDKPQEFTGHSLALQMLGVFILWFGWYGFNTGSIIYLTEHLNYTFVSSIAINTTLAASSGAIMTLFIDTVLQERLTGEVIYNLQNAMNGCLSGLVAITAGCSVVDSWASIVIGMVGGALYLLASKQLIRSRIDDAVDGIPVHLMNGIWGTLSVGFFAVPDLLETLYGRSDHAGWFYEWSRGSADATLLASQIIGILFVAAWVTATMMPFFWVLNYLGWLRSDSLEEVIGLDVGYTGGILQKRAQAQSDETQNKMDEYIAQYVKQREERTILKQANDNSTHSRSILGVSLHSVNNLLDNSLREVKQTSLTRATSAIDLMDKSNNSNRSSEVDLERSNRNGQSSSLAEANASRRVERDPVQQKSLDIQDEPWKDNK